MIRPPRNSRISGPGQQPLHDQHLGPGRGRQVAELVVRALGEDQVRLPQGVQQREAVGDDGGVVVLLEEQWLRLSRVWNDSRNFDRAVRQPPGPGRPARSGVSPYSWSYSNGPPAHRQPVDLVLRPAPEQVVQRAQRIEVEAGERVAARRASRRFWKRARIALSVWTSMPSSCQYDQISSMASGPVSLRPQDPVAVAVDLGRALQRDVAEPVADDLRGTAARRCSPSPGPRSSAAAGLELVHGDR